MGALPSAHRKLCAGAGVKLGGGGDWVVIAGDGDGESTSEGGGDLFGGGLGEGGGGDAVLEPSQLLS